MLSQQSAEASGSFTLNDNDGFLWSDNFQEKIVASKCGTHHEGSICTCGSNKLLADKLNKEGAVKSSSDFSG